MKSATPEIIEAMSQVIVEKFHPKRIILFGSYARGDAGVDSDVDLLVVENQPVEIRKEMASIRKALRTFKVPVDVLVCSEEFYQKYKDVGGNVIYAISREGKGLYGG